ncbi:unnamed protein product [Boreogadus saida]
MYQCGGDPALNVEAELKQQQQSLVVINTGLITLHVPSRTRLTRLGPVWLMVPKHVHTLAHNPVPEGPAALIG